MSGANLPGGLSRFPFPPLLERTEPSAFIGRETEFGQVGECWDRATAGLHQLVLLAGEPGIGKTRLAFEFCRAAHANGAVVLYGRTDEGTSLPYQAFVEALRHYVVFCETDPLRTRLNSISAELNFLLPELSERLPDLPVLSQAEPDSERYSLFETFTSLLSGVSQKHPLILVLDDLHWADSNIPLLLKYMVRSLKSSPILTLGTYRAADIAPHHPLSAALADLRRDTAVERLSLEGLNEREVGALVSARIGADVPDDIIRIVHEQTEGNPFFVEEVLHHLVDTGVIYKHEGRWMTDLAADNMGIPESVKEVIDQRLGRLTEECNSVLTIASVVGREFDLESLKRASNLKEEQLLELLDEAVGADVVAEVAHGVGRYSFSHALIYETLYDELTTTRRVRLHGQTLQYADNNGVKLAYEVLGGDGPFVVAVGLSNCPAVRPRNMNIARRWDRISRFCRVLLYDRRGVGFSAVPDRGYSLRASVEDLRAILDAAGAGRVVLWGAADGGPLAIAFAVQYPERVAGLILLGTSPKLYNSEDFTLGINPVAMRTFLQDDVSDQGRAVSQLTRTRYDYENAQSIVGVLKRVPQRVWSKILGSIGAADVRDILGRVKARTLIVHDPGNNYIPVEAAHYLHDRMSNSALEISEEYGGAMLFTDNLYGRIQAFVEEVTTRSHEPWDMFNYHFMRTREALLRGEFREAATHADIALGLARDTKAPSPLAMCHLAKAHVMHGVGKQEEATRHLKYAFNIARQEQNEQVEFHTLWSEAQFAIDSGDEVAGLRSLRRALAIGRKRGFLETLVNQPAIMERLCTKALEADMEVEYVQNFIRKRNLLPGDIPSHLENWPWMVRIYLLGRFQLIVDEKVVRFSRKGRQKPLLLLKALIGCGGKGVKEDYLADILWPDAEGDLAHRSFATTLHRLRNQIGHREIIQLQDGFLSLDYRYCWVDVFAFERLIGMADVAWEQNVKGEWQEACRFAQKAIDIYTGPFLAGETAEPWMISRREQLRSEFIRTVLNLGRHLEALEKWEEASTCYRHAIEVEAGVEEFYRHLIICYHNLGLRAEALSTYERCRSALSAVHGNQLSAEMESIRRMLRFE